MLLKETSLFPASLLCTYIQMSVNRCMHFGLKIFVSLGAIWETTVEGYFVLSSLAKKLVFILHVALLGTNHKIRKFEFIKKNLLLQHAGWIC